MCEDCPKTRRHLSMIMNAAGIVAIVSGAASLLPMRSFHCLERLFVLLDETTSLAIPTHRE
jgi:hypothetical protein